MNRAKNCFIFKDLLIRKKNKPLCFLKVLGAQSSLLTWKGMSRWASKSSLFQMFLLVLLCRCRSELWESIQLSLAQLWPEAGGTWWLFFAMTMLRGWCHRQEFSPIKKALKRTHVIFNHDLWTLWKFWTIGFEIGGFPDTSDPQLQWYPFCPRNRYLQVRRDDELPNVLQWWVDRLSLPMPSTSSGWDPGMGCSPVVQVAHQVAHCDCGERIGCKLNKGWQQCFQCV